MATMTNAEIIFRAQVDLVKAGLLEVDEDGIEPIHTFEVWRQMGYTVMKGEKALVKLSIWKQGTKKAKKGDNEDESGEKGKKGGTFFFLKESHFFKASQVAPLAAK